MKITIEISRNSESRASKHNKKPQEAASPPFQKQQLEDIQVTQSCLFGPNCSSCFDKLWCPLLH